MAVKRYSPLPLGMAALLIAAAAAAPSAPARGGAVFQDEVRAAPDRNLPGDSTHRNTLPRTSGGAAGGVGPGRPSSSSGGSGGSGRRTAGAAVEGARGGGGPGSSSSSSSSDFAPQIEELHAPLVEPYDLDREPFHLHDDAEVHWRVDHAYNRVNEQILELDDKHDGLLRAADLKECVRGAASREAGGGGVRVTWAVHPCAAGHATTHTSYPLPPHVLRPSSPLSSSPTHPAAAGRSPC
jgi:hypothetical protein